MNSKYQLKSKKNLKKLNLNKKSKKTQKKVIKQKGGDPNNGESTTISLNNGNNLKTSSSINNRERTTISLKNGNNLKRNTNTNNLERNTNTNNLESTNNKLKIIGFVYSQGIFTSPNNIKYELINGDFPFKKNNIIYTFQNKNDKSKKITGKLISFGPFHCVIEKV